jgi:prophage maintenance system killer protein
MIKFTKDRILILYKILVEATGGTFGIRDESLLQSAIDAPYQTFGGVELFPTIIEKAARLGYGLVSNHPFIDGNKRIAATLFIYFLEFYNLLYVENKAVIDNNTLVAITLLIAQSNPKEKDILIDLVMNFLKI